jgi:F-type H+-transporting ATPase subunit delta
LIVDLVTARYASALFNLASRQGVLADVERDLDRLGSDLKSPAVRAALFNPRGDRTGKRERVSALAASMHPLVQNLIGLLFDKRREELLADLPLAFRKRSLADRGAVEGIVETPRPLQAEEMSQFATKLGTRLGKEVLLENRVVPELVGGARLFADNRMIDYSVRGRLGHLREKMLAAKLPAPVPPAPHSTGTSGAQGVPSTPES